MGLGPEEFRGAARKFATGVTVVTVAVGDRLHGMTASAFASVSLDPPLVLVCLDRQSQTRSLVLEAGAFAVNVLRSDQEPIARAFSERGVKPFHSLPHRIGPAGSPLLDGAIAWIECRIHETIHSGDHDVIIGQVVASETAEGDPLLYFNRAYRAIQLH
ncbi:MAG: flavin reductase family protein [Actinomycetota bacterium]